MRRAAKTDSNADALDAAFLQLGCSVGKADRASDGFPDRAIGHGGLSMLVEYKVPGKPRYTKAQIKFRETWTGGIRLVQTLDDVQATVKTLRSWHAAIVAASLKP